jgi:hypothetical protein
MHLFPRLLGSHAFSALAVAALSIATLSALTPVLAGSYIGPVYTGGNAYQAAYTGHPVVPYALGSSTFQGGQYGGYGGDAGGTVNASCTDTITTTFTWQPDPGQTLTSDPPPLNVILQETCMAAASGNSIPAATVGGSCDNGLGASQGALTQTVTPYGSPPIFYTEYGSGLVNSTRYQIITGTPTITLTRTPSARVSCLQGVNASLRYTAAIISPRLTLVGTTKGSSGLANILIGKTVRRFWIFPMRLPASLLAPPIGAFPATFSRPSLSVPTKRRARRFPVPIPARQEHESSRLFIGGMPRA